MGKMYHVTAEKVNTSVPLTLYALALEHASKENPDALLSLSQSTIILDGAGPAWIQVDDQPLVRVLPDDDIRCFFLDPSQCFKMLHDDPSLSFQIAVQPSGESSVQPIGAIDGPQKAPAHVPGYVQEIYNWLYDGNVGQSSSALAYHLGFKPLYLPWPSEISSSVPHDQWDWNRCFLLLSRVPELQAMMSQMAEVSEDWKALVSSENGTPVWQEKMNAWKPLKDRDIEEHQKMVQVSFPK